MADMDPDELITITLPRASWDALATFVPKYESTIAHPVAKEWNDRINAAVDAINGALGHEESS